MLHLVNLYRRCRDFKDIRLPNQGGMLEQEEFMMQCFTVIHRVFEEAHQEKADDAIRNIEQRMRVAKQQNQAPGRRR